jgi:hypothetical protein
MKIATIVHKTPLNADGRAMFKYWVGEASKYHSVDNIVLVTDNPPAYQDLWGTVVGITNDLKFEPVYDKQHTVFSDYYRSLVYKVLGEPVLVVDLDCIFQRVFPTWDDKIFRIGSHNEGTAPHVDVISGVKVNHKNCAVTYFADDYSELYRECLTTVMADPLHKMSWTIGEEAYGLMYSKLPSVETLDPTHSWFASSPFCPEAKILHYWCEARAGLYKLIQESGIVIENIGPFVVKEKQATTSQKSVKAPKQLYLQKPLPPLVRQVAQVVNQIMQTPVNSVNIGILRGRLEKAYRDGMLRKESGRTA